MAHRLVPLLLMFVTVAMGFNHLCHMKKEGNLSFKRRDDESDCNNNGDGGSGFWNGVKRFLPGVVRARLEKSFAAPAPDTSMRYRLILKQQKRQLRRHAITRITRFLPDIQFETAAQIVDTSIQDEKALIRVLNSLDEAKFLRKMLLSADPPVNCEIVDDKDGSVIP